MVKMTVPPRSAPGDRRVRSTVLVLLAIVAMTSAAYALSTAWTRTFNGSANGFDRGGHVAVAPNGALYVVGSIDVTGESKNIWIRKYSSTGATLWTRTVDGPANNWDTGDGAAVDANGNLYVVGTVLAIGAEGYNIWIRKYSSAGVKRWTRTVNGPTNGTDRAYGAAIDANGNLYVVGHLEVTGQNYNIWIRKYSSAGVKRWTRTVNGPANGQDQATGAAVDANGNLYVVGHVDVTGESSNIWIRKYSSAGVKRWTRTVNGTANNWDEARGAAVDAGGNLYVVGSVDVTGEGYNIWIRKYNSAGVKRWTRTVNGPAKLSDHANGAAVDANGKLYVVGDVEVTDESSNIWIRKYNSAGVKRWNRTVNGPADGSDHANGTAVDANGNLYVAGNVNVTGEANNIWIRKYQP